MTLDLKTPNIGAIDRTLRGVAGTLLILWVLLGGPVWAWIGIVPLATALVSFCPLYGLLGLTTRPANHRRGTDAA